MKTITSQHVDEAKSLIKSLSINKNISLSRLQQNIVKHLNYKTEIIFGDYNGYGYERLGMMIEYDKEHTYRKLVNALNKFILASKPVKPRKILSEEQKMINWSKRLSKLTGIDLATAKEMAKEKQEYKLERVESVEERQYEHYSVRREKLINKMLRENPLRYIKDLEHANAILSASNRHRYTDYDSLLEEGRQRCEIDVRDYARQKIN